MMTLLNTLHLYIKLLLNYLLSKNLTNYASLTHNFLRYLKRGLTNFSDLIFSNKSVNFQYKSEPISSCMLSELSPF